MGVQLAVFLENRPGKLESITKALAEAGVNIRGIAIASEGDFGVLKILADDPEKALRVLREHHYTVSRRTVVVALIEDRPGGLHELLATLAAEKINIEDCYGIALEEGHRAAVVLDVERFPEAEAVLKSHGLHLLSDRELTSL
jgi:hypothetical protein